LQLPRYVIGHGRRLLANIGNRNDFPITALGQRPERPDAFPPTCARALVHIDADVEMIGPYLPRVEQAAQQRVAGAADRVQRPGAIESTGETHRLRRTGPAAADLDLQRV